MKFWIFSRTKNEFEEIELNLHEACINGEVDLIKIYLSETIQNDSKSLTFKIDKTNHTASLFRVNDENIEELIIPRIVEHESVEYLITNICGTYQEISLRFAYFGFKNT